ncbi:uncharacterized protein LOC106460405, partial [Limulus polyphemus]|uniref:Uncharacterized protein LOC106460405 n=1 Tax=Limulus polyphemus TaxID=6850 RepID=A0ABM1SGS4_LIMPO
SALPLTGYVSSSTFIDLYPPENAINPDKQSCTRIKKANPRWWRIDLKKVYHVLSVAITIPMSDIQLYQQFTISVINLKNNRPIYNKCSSFKGMFLLQQTVFVCNDGQGIAGQYIHINDDRPQFKYFGLCQVEVFIRKEITCQLLNDIQNGIVLTTKLRQQRPVQGSIASYSCKRGYVLHGNATRVCQDEGGWSGEDPECHQVTCRLLDDIQNGKVWITKLRKQRPVQGSIASYSCKRGYVLHGNATRVCQDDGGWSGEDSKCHSIQCGTPLPLLGGKYILLNETTTYHSEAELKCLGPYKVSDPMPLIRCQENGSWSLPQASCIIQVQTDADMKQLEDGNDSTLGIIIGIVLLGIIVILFVIGFIILRRKRCALEKQCISLPSRELNSFASSSYLASTHTSANYSLYQNKDHCSELPLENSNQKSRVIDSTNKDIDTFSNIEPPSDYSSPNLTSIKENGNSSTSKSSTSKETIYQNIHLCKNDLNNVETKQKGMDNKHPNNNNSKSSIPVVLDPAILVLYAKVDFDKTKSKNLETCHSFGEFEADRGKALNSDSRKENSDSLNLSQFSSSDAKTSGHSNAVPFRLCELSVIPPKEETNCLGSDRNHTNGTHMLLSEEPCVFLDNAIYAGEDNNATVMIENDLYSTI